MPSASTTLCEQCEVHPAKYTCPACKLRTCSLACTTAHKDVATAKRACSAASTASTSSTPYPSSIRRDTAPPTTSVATTSSAGTPTTYVPLSAYGESHMLQDYLFLSAISRTTAENGRRIMSLNLLPPSSSSPSSSLDTANKGGNAAVVGRQTNQQRQREQLLKQLHFRRFRVMVLPDGMARRRANQSQFSPKDKRMHLSVELTLPRHLSSKASDGAQDQPGGRAGRGWMLHKQDSLKTVQDVVLGELQHRSFPNKKELLKAKELFTCTNTTGSSSSSGSSKDKMMPAARWILSTRLLDDTGLPRPASATMKDDWIALRAWPAEWSVVVPCYSARLTNESTARYLEWWTRKRKWEEANPELAALQQRNDAAAKHDGEAEVGLERGNARPRYGEKEQEGPTSPAPATAVEEPSAAVVAEGPMGGIVSSSLLSMLSERLGRATNASSPSHAPPSQPSDQSSAVTTVTTAETTGTATANSSGAHKVLAAEDARSVRVHIVSPSATSLAWLLQTLPEGYSVVEFAELRVVASSLSNGQGGADVVPLLPERTVPPVQEGEEGKQGKVETDTPQPTVTQLPSGSLGALLAGYASDSDDDDADNDDDDKGGAETTEPNALAEDGSTDNTDKDPRGSLASLAALHGFLSHA